MDEGEFTEPATAPSTAAETAIAPVLVESMPRIGATVGRYVIVDELGRGGMGVVYAAYDRTLDRKIALKVLRPMPNLERSRERLNDEARAMARLNHPNIVTVHDVGEHEGHLYLAMEFIEGLTLRQWVKRRAPSVPERIRVILSAGHALVAAHAAGIVHRDFKPDNVMIDAQGRVKVLDFGVAHAGSPTSSERPATPGPADSHAPTGRRDGTLAYMAPEEHARTDSDERSDQFSYCVTAYEVIYGERPFAAQSAAELAAEILHGVPQAPPRGRAPARIWRLLERGLARRPEDRWPDLNELVTALGRDPSVRRGRILRFAVAGLVALGTGAGAWALRPDPNARCAEAAAGLDEHWNPTVRAEIDQHLRSFDSPVAAGAAEVAFERIEEFAETWRAGRYEACVQGLANPSEQTRHGADTCFETAALEMRAHLDMLRGDDPELIATIRTAADTLVPPRRCTDYTWIAAHPVHPSLTPELRARLARLPALQAYARLDDATREAAALVHEAEEIGHDALLAEALLHLGHLQRDAGEHEQAEATLRRAFLESGAVGNDHGQMAAASGLVWVIGARSKRIEEAEQWASFGRMAARRAGRTGSGDYGELSFALGTLHARHGKMEKAEADFADALARKERDWGSSHPSLSDELSSLANVKRGLGKFDEARGLLQRALELVEQDDGGGTRLAIVLNNLGSLEAQLGEHASAQVHLRRALARLEEAGFRSGLRVTVLGSLGASLASEGKLDEAEAMMKEALALALEMSGARHPDVATWRNNLGIFMRNKGELELAAEHLREAISIREEAFGPEHPAVAGSLHALAEVEVERGEPGKALELSRRAWSISGPTLDPKNTRRVSAAALLGRLELLAGDPGAARAAFEEVLPHLDAPGLGTSDRVLARFFGAQALVATDANDRDRAVDLARRALEEVDGAPAAHIAGVDREVIERWLATHE